MTSYNLSIVLYANNLSSIMHIGDAISKDPVLEAEPQKKEAAKPSNDVQGRPLCIPMFLNA
jgi:hypothetical protein